MSMRKKDKDKFLFRFADFLHDQEYEINIFNIIFNYLSQMELWWITTNFQRLNYYDLLNVSMEEVNPKVFKNAYHKLSLLIHPDKNQQNHHIKIELFTEVQKKLNEAYSVLKIPKSRYIYEVMIREKYIQCSTCNKWIEHCFHYSLYERCACCINYPDKKLKII